MVKSEPKKKLPLPAEWKLLVHSAKKPQFNVLRKLLRSKKFDYVVNACDAG